MHIYIMYFGQKQQRIEGFMCGPWLKGEKGNFLGDMSTWLAEVTYYRIEKLQNSFHNWHKHIFTLFFFLVNEWKGKLVPQETEFEGIESWPIAFQSLFTGEYAFVVIPLNLFVHIIMIFSQKAHYHVLMSFLVFILLLPFYYYIYIVKLLSFSILFFQGLYVFNHANEINICQYFSHIGANTGKVVVRV